VLTRPAGLGLPVKATPGQGTRRRRGRLPRIQQNTVVEKGRHDAAGNHQPPSEGGARIV